MTKEFKLLLHSNLMALLAQKNLKIGEFENKAGMTPGYISKLLKDDSKGNNILDFIVNASNILCVSIDSLVHVDISALTKAERYFSDFIDKIIRETTDGTLVWNREAKEDFENYQIRAKHPLFREYDVPYNEVDYSYSSKFDINADISSDCYNVELYNSTL